MYSYETQKPAILCDGGQKVFLAIRDNVNRLLKLSGAVRMQEAMNVRASGDSWTLLACVDRMVELGELRELTPANVAGQDRVFVSAK